MEKKYDIQALIDDLKQRPEMDPEKHDGSYEMMHATVEAYGELSDLSGLDYRDLNLVYLTTVGTWSCGISAKKKLLNESHLSPDGKEYLTMLWDEVWEKASRGEYENHEASDDSIPSVGMFGTGFFSFKRSTSVPSPNQVQQFIRMLFDLMQMTDEDQMLNRAEETLSSPIPGMQAGAASMILHCLAPCTFPILNSNMGQDNIYMVLGVHLKKAGSLDSYIGNCRRIKAFRDQNFSFKNYRIFDTETFRLEDFVIREQAGKRAWLLTWNTNNWQWDNYEEICEATKVGNSITDGWTCVSTKPRIGDDIFLMKLGEQPRGLIGHGSVIRESYEDSHFDPAKADEGKRSKYIDVAFDRLIDFNKERIITLEELKAKCITQLWSPQGSGIEIKPEVLPDLYALWDAATNNNDTDNQGEWSPSLSEYDPGLTADQYHDLFLNEQIVRRAWLQALYEMYQMPGHLATCKQLGETYGYGAGRYISYFATTAENIAKATHCALRKRDNERSAFWPILFLGKSTTERSQGTFIWKMRDPVVAAVERLIKEGVFEPEGCMEAPQVDPNTILCGPPGTGKTYNTVIYAVAICDGKPVEDVKRKPYSDVLWRYNELRDEGRIAFTTFHQSYGYEEFIEGIKPRMDEGSDTLGYSIEDGVFKAFCKRAGAVKVQAVGAQMKASPRIWGMILGGPGMTELKKQCFANDEIRLGWSVVTDDEVEGDFSSDSKSSWTAKHMVADFRNAMEVGDVVVIEKTSRSIDAIGVITGDYVYDKSAGRYPRSRAVQWLVKDIDQDMLSYLPEGRQKLARFSLFSFDYIGMGAISEILNQHRSEPIVKVRQETKPYVFIIDEINRGNISKVFGELITLIESTKRTGAKEAMVAQLPYSKEMFSVPQNVWILGTMNTADRSIALMDTALRRRFAFVEMMPDPNVLTGLGAGVLTVGSETLDVAKMLTVINERVEYLYDREHTIGHAFFTRLADSPFIETLADIFEKNVIPLLQEYFYDDYEKIQLVLGDNAKEDEFKFILDRPARVRELFNGNPDLEMAEKRYEIQRDAFRKIESYKQIGKDL